MPGNRPITRFAPSPTGLLHVGNAYSALCCQQWAEEHHADLLLRIDDIDHTRCRDAFVTSLIEDLAWLGIRWTGAPMFQSQRLPRYRQALTRLKEMGLVYPCFCTRREILEEIRRISSAPHRDEGMNIYPGTCRRLSPEERKLRMREREYAWRLNIGKALARIGQPLFWTDAEGDRHPLQQDQDIIIARRDIGISYHLATVVDDADQGITHIIRGEDLKSSLAVHRLLQLLLDLPEPIYIHHRLVHDARGRRLAKRDRSTTLAGLRRIGVKPELLRRYLLESPDLVWPDIENEAALLKALCDGPRAFLGRPT